MTITFFSSILNHHQISFCNAMRELPGVSFSFVQMIGLTEERRAQGFTALEEDFVVNAEKDPEGAHKLCMESDVVIAGVIPQNWVNARVAAGKLTFAYKERFCKQANAMLRPGFWKNGFQNYFRFRNQNLYLLCASSYTVADTKLIFPRPEKKFKWGYFPQVDLHTAPAEKTPGSILWVGRFLAWKHPEACIEVAKRLKAAGVRFQINLVGLGEMEAMLKTMIRENGLNDCVTLLGQMSPEQVRKQMGKSEIFLFTSDRKEGWGAVLNEAMSEGCACVASKQAGSTEFLIRNGENGFCYDCDDLDALTQSVKHLLSENALLRRVQKAAMKTITEEWNAESAAKRFIAVCDALLRGTSLPHYESGPMSRA